MDAQGQNTLENSMEQDTSTLCDIVNQPLVLQHDPIQNLWHDKNCNIIVNISKF